MTTLVRMAFIDHIRDLRKKFFISSLAAVLCSVAAFSVYDYGLPFLTRPFSFLAHSGAHNLFVTTLFEGFFTKIKLSIIAGLILSLPVHLYNAIRFVFPALKRREKWIVIFVLGSSFVLSALSFYLSYFQLIPFSIKFLTTTQFIPNQVGMLLSFQQNVFYILNVMLYSILLFQLPIVLECLLALNLVSRKALLKSSRYVVIGIFVLTAAVTPPDIVSQIGLAFPLIALFFLTLLIAKIFSWGKT